ncbi:MAG: hypothetical protein V4724_36385 [Pseudomonadota bacterium]
MKKFIVLAALLPQFASAGTGYYLVSTYDVEGQKSIDVKYWNADYRNPPRVSAPELGFGYGVTSRWYTELSAMWIRVHGRSDGLAALEWQNDYMLTQGQYPFDLALHTTISRAQDRSRGYGVEFGPVLQTEIGRTQFNLNLFFERSYRAQQDGDMELTYQWQVKQRWKSWLQPGVQGFGEVGKWNDWLPKRRQSHRAGPALFGSREAGAGRELKYEAAWLLGKNAGRSAKSFTMRLQYIF